MALFERFRATVIQILRIDDTPHRTAVTFAVGVFLGMSAFIGLHTPIALALAWVCRLNRAVILSGVFVNNPWSIIPIYTFSTWIGTVLLGTDIKVSDIDWGHLSGGNIISDLGQFIVPFVVGTTVVGLFSAVLSYIIIRSAAEGTKKSKADTGADGD
jgi:uncharacterized protein (DUF2062 family)